MIEKIKCKEKIMTLQKAIEEAQGWINGTAPKHLKDVLRILISIKPHKNNNYIVVFCKRCGAVFHKSRIWNCLYNKNGGRRNYVECPVCKDTADTIENLFEEINKEIK